MSEEPVVRVRGLRMSYGTHEVLTGVDLDVHPGEVVCLLGPNGAGKSTTIEVLEGFRLPSAGEVSVLGVDPSRADDAWRAQVSEGLQGLGWSARDAEAACDNVAHLVEDDPAIGIGTLLRAALNSLARR